MMSSGPGPQAARAGKPGRERRTQPWVPARIAVAEFLRWCLGQDRALGAQPQAPRKGRQIGHTGRQVDTLTDRQSGTRQPWRSGRPWRELRPGPGLPCRLAEHRCSAATAATHQTLVGEPPIGLDDDAP